MKRLLLVVLIVLFSFGMANAEPKIRSQQEIILFSPSTINGVTYAAKIFYYITVENDSNEDYVIVFICKALDKDNNILATALVGKGIDRRPLVIKGNSVIGGRTFFPFEKHVVMKAKKYELSIRYKKIRSSI